MTLPLLFWPGPRASGEVAGTTFFLGTITGSEGEPGFVTGTTTFTGTITGTYKRRTGSSFYPARPNVQQRKPEPAPLVRRSGTVSGHVTLSGVIVGRKSTASRALTEPVTYRCEIRGSRAASGVTVARITTRAVIHGTAITAVSNADLRRLRDDADLMLML